MRHGCFTTYDTQTLDPPEEDTDGEGLVLFDRDTHRRLSSDEVMADLCEKTGDAALARHFRNLAVANGRAPASILTAPPVASRW